MKYKVGDKVQIRDDLHVHTKYGDTIFASAMTPWLGKEVTIFDTLDDDGYFIKEDGSRFFWSDEMFKEIV